MLGLSGHDGLPLTLPVLVMTSSLFMMCLPSMGQDKGWREG
jgi:hypothetical protein